MSQLINLTLTLEEAIELRWCVDCGLELDTRFDSPNYAIRDRLQLKINEAMEAQDD